MESLFETLKSAVEDGEPDKAKQVAKELLKAEINPLKVIEEVLSPTMEQIGESFDRLDIFLPELVLAAEAMQAATSVFMEHLKESTSERLKPKGKVVIGTVQGDIHEIGKDIVKIILEVSGFEVFDLGKDVPSIQFIEKAQEVGADIIALSALMTSTMPGQRDLIDLLVGLGKRKDYAVLIGGAPTTSAWQEKIGADGWAPTAVQAAKVALKLMEAKA